ncbi:MAG: ATP-binding cassette domain-containing protein [Acidimicrobiales bacterium]
MDTVITLRGAVSVLGRFPALAGVDLDVARSEIVLVSGPNGAGKSTLLRLCAGLVNLARGEASILGYPLPQRRREVRRRVGYLGHANGLYPELTVAENVRFWSRTAGAVAPMPPPHCSGWRWPPACTIWPWPTCRPGSAAVPHSPA